MVESATSTEEKAVFPVFSRALGQLRLLPIETAGVERSFPTMHRILRRERCRLLSSHACQFIKYGLWLLIRAIDYRHQEGARKLALACAALFKGCVCNDAHRHLRTIKRELIHCNESQSK
jgi:hypothetical protein